MPVLEIKDLDVSFSTRFGKHEAVKNFSCTLEAGEIHGLVGESGAGKSTIGSAVLGILPESAQITRGSILLNGREISGLDNRAYHRLRGAEISMILQDPQTSLNPLLTIENHLVETIMQHQDLSEDEALKLAVGYLQQVGIPEPEQRIKQYPHQFSGGMRQRVVIALALCSRPSLIIADEPTTALDVAIQKQILSLIRNLAREQEVAVLLITHDMGVIAETTNTISILRNGHLVEDGDTSDVLGRPQKAYTRNLISAVPRIDRRLDRFSAVLDESAEITTDMNSRVKTKEVARTWLLENRSGSTGSDSQTLEISDLSVVFSSRPSLFVKKQQFRAVNRLNLAVRAGETLGLVGESGSGKSTVAKTIVGIHRAAAGSILFRNQKVDIQNKRKRDDPTRRSVQMIFQDPYSSLNNRWKIYDIVAEPLKFYKLHDGQLPEEKIVSAMIELVGLPTDSLYKYPHQFSGGQRQRIAIARALIARPEFLICDEPTSALDVTVQAIILNLIKDIQDQFNLSILFISHDLPVIRQMADEIAVMKAGEIVEYGPCESFFAEPQHVYSRALLADIPSLDLLGQPNNA